MYLKKIIAHGFKSFADNMVIDLDKNIAGVVGPNGSGKSNVVDAVRWVLGEQSIKSLRGDGSMTDVIFAGSKSRKPMNIASVTLIFDNKDNYLPIAYDEVSIKRRLYKDGTNEYFLNGEKCRLKDINDLLMDSGIVKESFNIISQGKIEEILSSKPTDRRVIFEEAAGVLKYKKRKQDALRKLDRTHDNMERVNDIIKELEVQVEPLREQKIAAEKYSSLADSLRNLEISLIVKDITTINEEYQKNKELVEKLTNEITSITTNSSASEAKIEQFKSKINDCDIKIKEYQTQLLKMTEQVEQLNSRRQIITERQKYQVDDQKLHDNLLILKEDKLKSHNDLESINRDIENDKNKLNDLNSKLNTLNKNINNNHNTKKNLELSLARKIRERNITNNHIDSLNDSIENNSILPNSVRQVIDNPKLSGIHNVIGNLIEVNEEHSKAISIALGASSSYVVVDNEKCAKEAINYLKMANIGRATFFPLDIIKPKYIDNETITKIKINGFIGIASDLVKYDKKYDNIIKNQLGNIIIVDNLDTATKLSKIINHRYRVVSLDGDLMHVGGSLTGGTIKLKNVITLKYELDSAISKKNNLESEITNIENTINELDFNLKALEDKQYIINKEIISIKDFITNKQNNIDNLNKRIIELDNQITGTNNLINNQLSKEEEEVLNDYYQAINEKNQIQNDLDKENNIKDNLSHQLEDYEYSVKKENSIYNQKSNELKNLEISVNRADVKLDNLLNTLNEEYTITYEKAKSLYILETDEKQARNKVSNLKREIKSLGPINMNAPEEYERVAERYEFLIKQQEDLSEAENTLLQIIDELDEVMEQEFLKTFKDIQKNFEETFIELFKGGQAKLELTDKDNLLETGIEIIASPPGKSLKSISLLSGGEKTFTAISLLFAILKTRTMPFCILDEVEAALDEVNVDAFGEYLVKMKEKTQFIVITHKKKTMEYADILYGITMQESGVSKLVSVKLEDIDK